MAFDWQNKMRKGSFRGVPFYVPSSERHTATLGRRLVLTELPKKDSPITEDMGRKASDYTMTLMVVGDDYMSQRDALMTALNKKGQGELIHPWLGLLTVEVSQATVEESSTEGGKATFYVVFSESPKDSSDAKVEPDTAQNLTDDSNTAQDAVEDDFVSDFSVAGVVDHVASDGRLSILDSMDQINAASSDYIGSTNLGGTWLRDSMRLKSGLTTLLLQPANLASSIYNQISNISNLTSNPFAALGVYKQLFGTVTRLFKSDKPAQTKNQTIKAKNSKAVNSLVKRSAVIEICRTVAEVTKKSSKSLTTDKKTNIINPVDRANEKWNFDSRTEAVAVKKDIIDTIDDLCDDASDDVFVALQKLKISTIKHIDAVSFDLAPVVSHIVDFDMPVSLLAYRLYGDAKRDQEILDRNPQITHPGFITSGTVIEVLRT